LRIPSHSGHPFRLIPAAVPKQAGHLFRMIAAHSASMQNEIMAFLLRFHNARFRGEENRRYFVDRHLVILDSINEGVFTIDLNWRTTTFQSGRRANHRNPSAILGSQDFSNWHIF